MAAPRAGGRRQARPGTTCANDAGRPHRKAQIPPSETIVVGQTLALDGMAARAARAVAGSAADQQRVLEDLRSLRSAAVSSGIEWAERDGLVKFQFYGALRLAEHVLCDMISRFEEARTDPSGLRAALDGLAVQADIIGIVAVGGVRADAGERDGEGMEDREMALLEKARAAGLLEAMRENFKKLGPRTPLTERDTPETRPDIIWIQYDDDTGEMRRITGHERHR